MENLKDSGFNLRTLKVRNIHQLTSDIQYNFSQILQLSSFKGLKGKKGDSITGDKGDRGSKWFFADGSRFISIFSQINSSGQVNLNFLNIQLKNALTPFLLALKTSDLVNNDVIVLPSRDVVQFDSTNNKFVETDIRFADGMSLTEKEVVRIINNVLGGINSKDVFTTYKGIVKNYADNALGLNIDINQNSILDIDVLGAGVGVKSTDFMFTSLQEAVIDPTMKNMLLTGSPKKYHELVQKTMVKNTVDFMAGVDDFGALAIMQNSLKNGIILGHKDASSFAEWSRIYNSDSYLNLISNYDPRNENATHLKIGRDSKWDLSNSLILNILGKKGFFKVKNNLGENFILFDENQTALGNKNTRTSIISREYLKLITPIPKNTHLVGVYGDMRLKESDFQPKNDDLTQSKTSLVTHNLLFKIKSKLDVLIKHVKNINIYATETKRGFVEISNTTEGRDIDNHTRMVTPYIWWFNYNFSKARVVDLKKDNDDNWMSPSAWYKSFYENRASDVEVNNGIIKDKWISPFNLISVVKKYFDINSKANTLLNDRVDKLEQQLLKTIPIGLTAIWGKTLNVPTPLGWVHDDNLDHSIPIGFSKVPFENTYDSGNDAFIKIRNGLRYTAYANQLLYKRYNNNITDFTIPDIDKDIVHNGNTIKRSELLKRRINNNSSFRVVRFIKFVGIPNPLPSLPTVNIAISNKTTYDPSGIVCKIRKLNISVIGAYSNYEYAVFRLADNISYDLHYQPFYNNTKSAIIAVIPFLYKSFVNNSIEHNIHEPIRNQNLGYHDDYYHIPEALYTREDNIHIQINVRNKNTGMVYTERRTLDFSI